MATTEIADALDGMYAAHTMPKKSDTTAAEQAALRKRAEAGEWLRIGDAAKALGLSRSKVDLMIRAGAIRHRLVPGSRYRECNPADIEKLLADSQQEVRGTPASNADDHSKLPSVRGKTAAAGDS